MRNNIKNSLFFFINSIMSTDISDNPINNGNNNIQTDTDMMFNMFANSEKMVSEDKVQEYEKNYNYDRNDKNDYTENLNDYIDSEDNYSDNNYGTSENNQQNNYTNQQNNYTNQQNNYTNQSNDYTNQTNNDNDNDNYNYHEDNLPKKESKEELILKKLDMLRKLGELAQYGVKLSQNYNINSDFDTMKYEYELHRSIRAKRNGVNWMSSMMMNCVYGLEMLNEKYDPFSIKLKGWSEQMNSEQDTYYDVFGELYEKYSKPGKSVPPEIKLMLMISGSAIKFHLANTLMGSMPNLQEKFSQNPELAQKLREQATRDKLKQQAMKKNESFNKTMNQHHDLATQKARDIEMLKRKKTEFDSMQERQNDIIANKRKLDLLKKELNHTHKQAQFKIPAPTIPSELSSRLNMSSVNYAPVNTPNNNEIDFERKLQITEHKKKMQENNNNTEDDSNLSISDAYSNSESINTQDSKVMIKKRKKKKKKNKLNISTE